MIDWMTILITIAIVIYLYGTKEIIKVGDPWYLAICWPLLLVIYPFFLLIDKLIRAIDKSS